MNNGEISDANGLAFTDPATDGITLTSGLLPADDIMGDSLANTMALAVDGIQFAVVTDVAAELDHLVLPKGAFAPSATPTLGDGSVMVDTASDKLWFHSSGAWVDASLASEAQSIQNAYTADEILLIRDALYISAADNVSKADATGSGDSTKLIGFAVAAAADTASVEVQSSGVMGGFSSLTAGARQFLSETAGEIVETKPTGNVTVVQAGYAKSTTEVQIAIAVLGRSVA